MIDRVQANAAPLKSKDRFGPCVANGRYLRTADGWCRRPANPNSSRARSRRSLRRGSVGLVRPPEGDGLADVLAGSECIQDEAADVGSRNRRKDGARAAPCDLAAGCLQPSSSGSDGRWCSRGRSHGPLALARPCRRVPLGGAGRRARARVIRRRLGCPRHRTSSGRSGGERLRPSGPQSGFACLEKRRGGPAGSG